MTLHGKADDRSIIAVQHSGQIQLAIHAFDLCDIAQVFDAWRRGSEIPLHQILALWIAMITFCQTMRTLFALQQTIFLAETIAFPIAWTKRRIYGIPQSTHTVTWVLFPCFFQGRYQLRVAVCPHRTMLPGI